MNCLLITLIILNIFGVLECRRSDIDINREGYLFNKLPTDKNQNNDHDGNSGRSPNIFRSIFPSPTEKARDQSYQIHAPKEDPRLFYQSDIYLKEMRTASQLNEASQIYPGKDLIRADEPMYTNSVTPMRFMSANLQKHKRSKICIKCPGDRTLVGKTGLDLVLLNKPSLLTCAGKRSPKYVKLVHLDGPKFGSLLKGGSYQFTGNIMYKQKIVQYCKMKIHIITQECFAPKYLSVKCDPETKLCNFTCTGSGYELIGPSNLLCNSTKEWNGTLPYCKARPQYCGIPPAPENGRLSCESTSKDGRLPEGTKCKIYCNRGLRKNKRMSFCIRGKWTHTLSCRRRHLENGKSNEDPTSRHFISLKEFNK